MTPALAMPTTLTHADLEVLELWWSEKSKKNFFAFRQFMRANDFTHGWFIVDMARALQQFYLDLKAGKKPILVIQTPPQHGKSWTVTDLIAWLAGKMPELRIIYASFSERLGNRCNAAIKRYMDGDKFKGIFNEVQLPKIGDRNYSRTNDFIEYLNTEGLPTGGSFRNTTVGGPVTGETLDLGVIDDPIKGREQANSKTVLDKVWDWFTNDFYSRFSENAGLLIITTRWNIRDLVGRLIEKLGDNVKVLNFQAISTAVETHRGIGQPLFPELKSLKFLLGKKSLLASSHWESLYQGKPTVEGGNLFKDNHWKYYTALPKMRFRMIYADTALKKEEQHDWSVLQCWGMSYDGHIYLLDQVRKKVEAPQLLTMARAFWNKHNDITNLGVLRQMKPEDKASGTGLIQTLRQEGIPIKGIQRNRDKVSRANDVTPMIEVGNVYIPEDATWLNDYLVEFSAFPNGDNDDQIDPTMDAIEDLLINPAVVNYEDLI